MEAREDGHEAYEAYRRGRALARSRDFRAATVALERAKRLEPDKGSIREALGHAYLSCRSYDRAAAEFAVAIELAPTDAYAHWGLARSLEALGEAERAARHRTLARWFGSEIA